LDYLKVNFFYMSQKSFFLIYFFLLINLISYSQNEIFNYQFAQIGTNYTSVTQTMNVDSLGANSFNVFHENDSLFRFIFMKDKVVKKLSYYVEMSSEKIEFDNAIPLVDFYSLKENTFSGCINEKTLSEYYINKDNHNVYLLQTDIENAVLKKDKIAILNKKESILASYYFEKMFFILICNSNDDYLRIVKLKNNQKISDEKISDIDEMFLKNPSKNLISSKKISSYFNKLKVFDSKLEYGINNIESLNKGYFMDSLLFLQLYSNGDQTNFLKINLINNNTTFKTFDTKLRFTYNELKLGHQSIAITKNYLIKYFALHYDNDPKFCIDVYNINENKLLQSYRLDMNVMRRDSFSFSNWDGSKLVTNKRLSINDNIYEIMSMPMNLQAEENENGDLILNLGYYKQIIDKSPQILSIITSIAASLTFTYLINAIPKVTGWGYAVIGFNSKVNIKEYTFSIYCNLKNKNANIFLPKNVISTINSGLIKEARKAKSNFMQFATIKKNNEILIGLIDNTKKQFKVFAMN
jgi:hypothetical protein